MLKKVTLFLSLLLFSNLHAFLVGNPSSPGLFTKGLFSQNQIFYLRCGYFYDDIYRGKYKEDFNNNPPKSTLKLRSQGAAITLNIKNRWDLYTLLGASKMNLGDQVFTNEHLSWCVGTKFLLYKIKNIDFTVDGKYFHSNQDTEQFILEEKVYPVVTENFGYKIEQYQASAGLSYKFKMIVPYIGATYLYSTIKPYPTTRGLVRYPYPDEDTISDFTTESLINSEKWGFIAGLSIISNNMVSVNAESRFFDQNAFNVSAEIRF